jgi:antitoxin component of RelBE/YafQ-DinJ toxin-antitoxin module
MTISEIIPIITSLSHTDKFKLMQIILAQLAKEEGIPLEVSTVKQQDPLFDVIGIAEGEAVDVARRHDDYLYGAS